MIFILGLACFLMYFIYGKGVHTVTFNSNDGSSVPKEIVKDNELAHEPTIPERNEYKFDGWYLDDSKYDFREAVTKDITLVAKWKKIYTIKVKIEDSENSYEFLEGDVISIDKLNIPAKDGYTIHLYYNGELYNLDTPINSNLLLELKYDEE